jgi:hypothetical protein
MKTNLHPKARFAWAALKTYQAVGEIPGETTKYTIVDLLADLMHLCAPLDDVSFEDVLSLARKHFDVEVEERARGLCHFCHGSLNPTTSDCLIPGCKFYKEFR